MQSITADPNFTRTAGSTSTTRSRPGTPRATTRDAAVNRATRRSTGTPADSRSSTASTGCPGSRDATTRSTRVAGQRSSTCRPAAGVLPRRRRHRLRRGGNLYLSTGDDTNPFDSDGSAPIDERPEPQPGVRRATHLGQQQRPARQGAPDQAEGRRRLHDPGGQPVPAGRAADPCGDLPDGPPQPVPDRGQPAERRPVRRATTRRMPTSRIPSAGRTARASGSSRAGRATTAGRSARPTSFPTRTTTSRRRRRVVRSIATISSTTRRTTPAWTSCRRRSTRTSGTATACRQSSRSSVRAGSGRWPVRRTSTARG